MRVITSSLFLNETYDSHIDTATSYHNAVVLV